MFNQAYSEVVADSWRETRHLEREVLLDSIALMERADIAGVTSHTATQAVFMVSRLWCHLIEDLGRPDNQLPAELRAQLISIGLFLIRATDEIRAGQRRNFVALIDISRCIAEGLKA